MELVLIEKRLDRAAKIVQEIPDKIGKILIYQSKSDFDVSIKPYRKETFFGKIQRVYAWDLFEVLNKLYDECDESGQPKYIFLFNLCLESASVPFLQKLSTTYIRSKEGAGNDPRCFVFSTLERIKLHFDPRLRPYVVETDRDILTRL